MAIKNMSEFTDELIGLIKDVKQIETKVLKLRATTKDAAKFYFNELDLNVAKVEQTLTDLFDAYKPTKKKGGKNGK